MNHPKLMGVFAVTMVLAWRYCVDRTLQKTSHSYICTISLMLLSVSQVGGAGRPGKEVRTEERRHDQCMGVAYHW